MKAEDFTREDLLGLARNDYDITDFPKAGNPSRPTKQEIIDTIEDKKINATRVKVVAPKLTKAQKIKAQKKELLSLRRVIVTEVHATQSYESDDSARLTFVTWGNTWLGFTTNKVVYNTPWMLPQGCINNLKAVTASIGKTTPTGAVVYHTVKKYDIKDLGVPDKEGLAVISKRQALRKSMS